MMCLQDILPTPEKNIDEYVQQLQLLNKNCNFKAVNVTQNQNNCITNDFISGLHSLTACQTVDQAQGINDAQMF